MNKRHLKNLTKLADFLETEVTDKQFDIGTYLSTVESSYVGVDKIVPECGTVGCAVGWASSLFYKEALRSWTWTDFQKEVFGCDDWDSGVGEYMFHYSQPRGQRTRKATIKRIRKVVANRGELP